MELRFIFSKNKRKTWNFCVGQWPTIENHGYDKGIRQFVKRSSAFEFNQEKGNSSSIYSNGSSLLGSVYTDGEN